MKLWILAVGHRPPGWVGAGFEDYARRMPREAPIALVEVKPQRRSPGAGPAQIQQALEIEARRIAAACPKECYTVVLDERGVELTTHELSRRMGAWRQSGRDVGFVIGGADGTAAALRSDADLVWSLSRLTLPHFLVRLLLAEQLYRAASMLGGHPYHRA